MSILRLFSADGRKLDSRGWETGAESTFDC